MSDTVRTPTGCVSRFRKIPAVVEAMQYTGDNREALFEWVGVRHDKALWKSADESRLYCTTANGDIVVHVSDWICAQRLPSGRLDVWPVAADIFDATYEPAARASGDATGIQVLEGASLRSAALEAADELEATYRAQYSDGAGGIHPAYARKFERDMDLPRQLRASAASAAPITQPAATPTPTRDADEQEFEEFRRFRKAGASMTRAEIKGVAGASRETAGPTDEEVIRGVMTMYDMSRQWAENIVRSGKGFAPGMRRVLTDFLASRSGGGDTRGRTLEDVQEGAAQASTSLETPALRNTLHGESK